MPVGSIVDGRPAAGDTSTEVLLASRERRSPLFVPSTVMLELEWVLSIHDALKNNAYEKITPTHGLDEAGVHQALQAGEAGLCAIISLNIWF